MQTLVRIVVAFVIVVLLLLVVLPIQLINMLVENEPKYEPGKRAEPPTTLRANLGRFPRLEPPPHPRPQIRSVEFEERRLIPANDLKNTAFYFRAGIGPISRRFTA
jgi:hypothetical protein